MSHEPKQIYSLVPKVTADIGSIGKDARNDFHKFNYRSIDAVYAAIHSAIIKHGVTIAPNVIHEEHDGNTVRLLVSYTLYAPDGSSISSTVAAEATDKADKATAKAMSMAFKYWAFQQFCIPIAGTEDGDAGSGHREAAHQRMAKPAPKPAPAPPAKNMAAELEALLGEKWVGVAKDFYVTKGKLTEKQFLKHLDAKQSSWAVNNFEKFIVLLEEFMTNEGDVPT